MKKATTRIVSTAAALLGYASMIPSVCLAQGPQIDVRSYGARCNGSDDSQALQAALNAVPASGGTVLIPCQLGIGASGARVSGKSNVVIKASAAGAGLKSLARTGQGAGGFGPVLLVLQQCTGCQVRDLTFAGNNVGVAPLGLDRCSSTIIENNTIANVGGNVQGGALVSSGGRDNQYLRNTINGTGTVNGVATRAMWIGNSSSAENEWRPVIRENVIRNASATGIATHAVAPVIIGNTVHTTLGAGIKIAPPPSSSGTSLVEGNTLTRNHFHGIQINDAFDVIVRNNIAEENDEAGIWGHGALRNSQIVGNTVRNNNFDKQGGWLGGIYLHHASNVRIENNDMHDTRSGADRSQDTGIILNAVSGGGISNVTIRGNICRNHTVNGIYLQTNAGGTMSGISLEGNTCKSNSRYGIQLEERTAGAIRNVTASGNTLDSNTLGPVSDNTVDRLRMVSGATPLSLSITSPIAGQSVAGLVYITANASNAAGVTLRVDGTAIGPEITSPPYSRQWDTTKVSNGQHSISAIARSSSGATTTDAVTVTVNNGSIDTAAPLVSITSPSAGATVSGVITLAAAATDNAGVAGVRFLVDGSPSGSEDTTSPYSTSFDTALLGAGNHTVTAVARDAAGNTATSAAVSFAKGTGDAPSSLTSFITSYTPGSLVTGGYAGWVGARIKVGSNPISVHELGRYTLQGNKGAHTLKIVDAATGAEVPGSTVNFSLYGRPAGQFAYFRLIAPVTLAAGRSYYIVCSENVLVSGGDAFQEYNGVIGTTSHARMENAVFWDRTLWRPLGSVNQSVGPVSFRYTTP